MDIAHFWVIDRIESVDLLFQVGGLLGCAAALAALVDASRISHFVASLSVLVGLLIYGNGNIDNLVPPLVAAVVFAIVLTLVRPRVSDPVDAGTAALAPRARPAVAAVAFLALAAFGFFWAEGVTSTIEVDVIEVVFALIAGIAGVVGGFVGATFVDGAIRAGGHGPTIALIFSIAAVAAGLASFLLPGVGYLVAVLVAVMAWRMRRRSERKYKGLRILS